MELFTIQCTTCRVRLKVKDESVIGDILACPKCGSMVQVVPPVGWKRGAAAASAAATADASSSSVSIEASAAPKPATPPAHATPATPGSEAIAPRPAASAPAAAATAPPAPIPPAPASAEPAAATVATSALVTRLKSDWPVLTGGLAAGALLGVAVWLMAMLGNSEPEAVAVDSQPPVSETSAEPSEQTSASTPRPESSAATPDAALAPRDDAASVAAAEPALKDPEPAIEVSSSASGEPPAAAAEAEPAPEEQPPSAPAPAASEAPRPAIRLEPAEKRPAPSNLLPDAAAAPPPSAADQPLPDEQPKPRPGVSPGEKVGDDELAAAQLTVEDIEARLAIALPSVRFDRVPLAQFARFIADFTALDVRFDDRALAAAGRNRQTPVSVMLADTTADDALRAALRPLGLVAVARDGRLVITAAAAGAPAR